MDLFIAVVWEVLDKQDPSAVALSKKFWGFTVKVTYGEITWVFEHLFGARP